MPLPRAVLFDLDDTIITEGERHAILLELAAEFRAALPRQEPTIIADQIEAALQAFWSDPVKAREARLRSAAGIREARQTVIEQTFQSWDISDATTVAAAFSQRFTELRIAGGRMFDGARETLDTLKSSGVRLALVTNGAAEIQRAKVERFSLTPLFHHVQIEGEHGFGKPEERAYHHAMDALGVKPAETWMVGDNLEWEVAAPQRLGIHGIWHDHLGKGLPRDTNVRPDRIIRTLPELLV